MAPEGMGGLRGGFMLVKESFIYRQSIRINTPGHLHFYTFSCFKRLPLLTNDVWCGWLAESINHARKKLEIDLWAYVFMPEHVHLLLKPRRESYRISEFMQLVKHPMTRRVINSLKKVDSPLLKQLEVPQPNGFTSFAYWQAGGGHDINIWDKDKAIEKAEYCHRNPIKRGLVQTADQWRWSSFRWIEMGARENEPLTVDEWTDG